MGEVFAWPEGAVWLWTGTASAAGVVAYAQDTRADFDYGVNNYATLDGIYHNQYTGQRVDVSIGALYAPDASALMAMCEARTAIHAHFKHSANGASAGHVLYTGAVDRLSIDGREGALYRLTVSYHANVWTAY